MSNLSNGNKPAQVSLATSLLIDSILLLFRSIAPLSFVGLGVEWFSHRRNNRTWLRKVWLGWIAQRGCLLGLLQVVADDQTAAPTQRGQDCPHHPEERRQLFVRCLDNVASPEAFIESWFLADAKFHHLTLENVREFLAWGMFHRHDYRTEMSVGEREELEGLVELFLSRCTLPLAEERGNRDLETAKLMKFTADPVTHTHRPLALYVLLHHFVQEMAAPLRFAFKFGFQRKQCQGPCLLRVARQWEGRSVAPASVCAWNRDRAAPLRPGGDGFGGKDPERPLAAVWQVGGAHRVARHKPEDRAGELLRDGFVCAVRELFAREELGQAVFLGHSYGSFAVGWICQRAPELVAGVGCWTLRASFCTTPKRYTPSCTSSPAMPWSVSCTFSSAASSTGTFTCAGTFSGTPTCSF
ncbi:hypothetical protein BASA81_003581 [Batrachochytrium salamandrivorans]|nr:hypothetical protein BASA81_003581 [Batrachochytrium salamandrivorans]